MKKLNSKIRKIFKKFHLKYKLLLSEYIRKHKPMLYYYFMIFFGLILFSSYLYVRFLRIRLPRDIPFTLSFYSLIILSVICIMFLYRIKLLMGPSKINHNLGNIIHYFMMPLKYLLMSVQLLDTFIKNNSIVEPYYTRFMNYLLDIISEFGSAERIMLAYCFMIIPGYISLFILIVDVFWLNQIKIFYYFLCLGILPLVYLYYRYSLKALKEHYFAFLESHYKSVTIYDENVDYRIKFVQLNPKAVYHGKEISIRDYFDIQLQHRDLEYEEYDEENPDTYEILYIGYANSNAEKYNQYTITHNKTIKEYTYDELQILQKEFNIIEPKLLTLMEYLDLNQYTHNTAYIKPLRIIMYALYFVTWFYIIVKSLHTLPTDTFGWLISKYDNPFE